MENRRFDDFPNEDWEAKDIAMWSAHRMINHEAVCAERWGTVRRLMWGTLSGVGLILVTLICTYITHIAAIIDKAR